MESCIALWLPIEREDIPIAIAPVEQVLRNNSEE
jgi:hypothetical protein